MGRGTNGAATRRPENLNGQSWKQIQMHKLSIPSSLPMQAVLWILVSAALFRQVQDEGLRTAMP
jgi:hypothetical protein